jgi:hypothetical protein
MRALVPEILTAVLGVVAAALAYRDVVRRARRRQPPDRPGPDRR